MAEQLEEFDFTTGRPTKYPWDQWLDGSIWVLVKDKDFEISIENMRHTVNAQARSVDMAARTAIRDNRTKLIIQAYPIGTAT